MPSMKDWIIGIVWFVILDLPWCYQYWFLRLYYR